ncbi:MAG: IMP dehydrogenase [Patescibacteria group bacterium]
MPLALTFDDVLLVPQESRISPREADVSSFTARGLKLAIPLLSAAMDTITDARFAVALASEGGIGVLHRNCTVEEQVEMVKKIKGRGAINRARTNVGANGRSSIRVAAAVGPGDLERAITLDKAGVDAIVFDSAHIHKPSSVAAARALKKKIKAKLIVGNMATAGAARAFLGIVDGLKVGVGPGSICTTRVVTGVGVPQLTAIMDVARVAKQKGIPVIADGGIRYSGDIVKALAAGASAVMLGSLFAGTDEAPGKKVLVKGVAYKTYRGMGSLGAMEVGESSDRYFQKGSQKYVPEGVEGAVPAKGPLSEVIAQLVGGLKSGMGYMGAKTILELQKRAKFVRITGAGRRESHPHSVVMIRPSPNYHA